MLFTTSFEAPKTGFEKDSAGFVAKLENGLSKTLSVGADLIEFSPQKTGTIAYFCWMGMISSGITVVKSISSGSLSEVPLKRLE